MDKKIAAVTTIDVLFEGYQVTATPVEALELVRQLPAIGKATPAALELLVKEINVTVPQLSFGKTDPTTGRSGHVFHIGKERNRLIAVEVLRAYFPENFDCHAMLMTIDAIATRLGCGRIVMEDAETAAMIKMIWD